MKVHRKLIVAYVLTGLFPMCLMFTLFYTQMRRVLVEREIKNLQTTFDQAVDDVNTEACGCTRVCRTIWHSTRRLFRL